MMREAISFLQNLDQIHLVAFPAAGGKHVSRNFGTNAIVAAQWAQNYNNAEFGIYWTTNAVTPEFHSKPSKRNITRARYLHVDIDPPKDKLEWDKSGALRKLQAHNPPPNLIIDSGNGYQGFWQLKNSKAPQEQIEAANRVLRDALDGDACHNIDRLMRVAGFTNWPNEKKQAIGRTPVKTALVHHDADTYFTDDWVAKLARSYVPVVKNTPNSATLAKATLETCKTLSISFGTLQLAVELPRGVDRSGDVLNAIRAGRAYGLNDTQIAGLLLNPDNAVSAHPLDQNNPLRAVQRALDSVTAHDAPLPVRTPPPPGGGVYAPRPYTADDESLIPPRQFIYGKHLLRGTVSVVIAPGGVGKSSLMVADACALATGRKLLHNNVYDTPCRVWMYALEDDALEMRRSLAAARKHYALDAKQLAGNLFVNSALDDAGLCTAVDIGAGVTMIEPVMTELTAHITRLGIDAVIIDPFVSSHSVNENDNGAIDAVVKRWARLAKDCNCTVTLVHHSRKSAGGELDADSARGASALVNAARSVITLSRMTPKEAELFGVQDAERARYTRVYSAKANRAPPSESSDWLYMQSVRLLNGDDIGVTTAVMLQAASNLPSADVIAAIQSELRAPLCVKSPRAANWAGIVVAPLIGLNSLSDAKRVQDVVRELLAAGALKESIHLDESGKMREYITAV